MKSNELKIFTLRLKNGDRVPAWYFGQGDYIVYEDTPGQTEILGRSAYYRKGSTIKASDLAEQ